MSIVDSHHHFWKYTTAEYGWIPDSMAVLRQDYLPAHLAAEMAAGGVQRAVSVQVRQTVEESRWLLEIADATPFIAGVVGWVPLAGPSAGAVLEELAVHPKFRGVRHILQDEPANELMDDPAFRRGIGQLARHGLTYDILIHERHLDQAIRLVRAFPGQIFVLDHIAKPRIRQRVMEPWARQLREISQFENVYCKLSGIATEADWANWEPGDVRPYMDHALECFGPRRLMFGSDWPVMLVATSYGRWRDQVLEFASSLSRSERDRLLGGTAVEAYRL
ncbi:MAG: amidohydrolase [Acidobacteria bacterium]|nr:amidohydrolase [Acidobacteriota bacterium]